MKKKVKIIIHYTFTKLNLILLHTLDTTTYEDGFSISCNFVDCINNRERGTDRRFQNMRLTSEYATRHMLSNAMMKEYPISQKDMNKVDSPKLILHSFIMTDTVINTPLFVGFLQPMVESQTSDIWDQV